MNTVESTIESIPNGARIVSIFTETSPKLLKKSRITGLKCPYLRVIRRCWRNGMIGASYERAVDKQRDREGHDEEFKAESLWNGKGQYVQGSKRIVEHTEEMERYLAFMPKSVDNTVIVSNDTWEADAMEVTQEDLAEYLPISKQPETQETEKVIHWRVIKLDSIKAIRYANETINFV